MLLLVTSVCVKPPCMVLGSITSLMLAVSLPVIFPCLQSGVILLEWAMQSPCKICQHVVPAAQPARLQELYPNGSQGQVYFEEYFPYPIWKDEEMHALLVDAALSAANAIATSGKPVRTGKHVMLRMDLILMTSDSKVLPPHSQCHACAANCAIQSGCDDCGTSHG